MIIGANFGGVIKPGDARNHVIPTWLIAKLGITCHVIVMPESVVDFEYFIACLRSARAVGLTQVIIEIPMTFISGDLSGRLKRLPFAPIAVKVGREQDDPKLKMTPAQHNEAFMPLYSAIKDRGWPVMTGGKSVNWRWWQAAMKTLPKDVIFDFHVLNRADLLAAEMRRSIIYALKTGAQEIACTELGTWSGTHPTGVTQTEEAQGRAIVAAMDVASRGGVGYCCGALWPNDNLGAGGDFEHYGLWTARLREKGSARIIKAYVKQQ